MVTRTQSQSTQSRLLSGDTQPKRPTASKRPVSSTGKTLPRRPDVPIITHPVANVSVARRSFDAFYILLGYLAHLDVRRLAHTARTNWRTIDQRVKRILLIQGAVLLSLMLLMILALVLLRYVAVITHPTAEQLVAAPYLMERRPLPDANSLLPMTAVDVFTRSTEAQELPLLVQCVQATANGEPIRTLCPTVPGASYFETANFVSNDQSVIVAGVQFASEYEAHVYLNGLFDYSRSIGRTGNFSMRSSQSVNYYYSSSRNIFAFTWMHDNIVYTLAAPSVEALDTFLKAFPY